MGCGDASAGISRRDAMTEHGDVVDTFQPITVHLPLSPIVAVHKGVSLSSSRLLGVLLGSDVLVATTMGGSQALPIAPAALSVLDLDGVELSVTRRDDLTHRAKLGPSRIRSKHLPHPALEVINALHDLLQHNRIERAAQVGQHPRRQAHALRHVGNVREHLH